MTVQNQPKHYKSKKEDRRTSILVDIVLLAIFAIVVIVCTITRDDAGLTDALKSLISLNPFSVLLLFLLLSIVYSIVMSVVYNRKKKLMIEKGTAFEGQIEDTVCVKAKFNKSPGVTYDYKYRVRLSDGRTVDTEVYHEDFAEKDRISRCTVYEYNGRCYFTDFR